MPKNKKGHPDHAPPTTTSGGTTDDPQNKTASQDNGGQLEIQTASQDNSGQLEILHRAHERLFLQGLITTTVQTTTKATKAWGKNLIAHTAMAAVAIIAVILTVALVYYLQEAEPTTRISTLSSMLILLLGSLIWLFKRYFKK